jgi:acetyl-CoA C-acetyltransferase
VNGEFVIVSAIRTPIGRAGGSLKDISSGHLAAITLREATIRAGLEPQQIDEVILGEVRQTSESSNVARVAALRAGIPDKVSAFTVNRLCASGMQAVVSGVQQLAFGQAEIVAVGGTENLSRAPIYLRNARFGEGNPQLVDSNMENGAQPSEIYGSHLSMVVTAENVAENYGVSREDQDAFAVESQRRTQLAKASGRFQEEIVPVTIKNKKQTIEFLEDEHPRPQTTIDLLAKLRPIIKENGTVTAGNACGRNDGSAAMIIMSAHKAKQLNLKPMAKIVDWATSGISPEIMGVGPIPAVKKLLAKTGMNLSDIGLFELNEAFASQALAVIRELGIDIEKVNVNGGAIALGHPLGATGARIMTTLSYEMRRRNVQFGIATLCIGGGQGMAILLELL